MDHIYSNAFLSTLPGKDTNTWFLWKLKTQKLSGKSLHTVIEKSIMHVYILYAYVNDI